MSGRSSRKTSPARLHRPNLGPVVRRAPVSESERDERRKLIGWCVVVGGMLVWAAWPDEETGAVVYSRSGCAAVKNVALAECEAAYDQATADHERLAPRFDSKYQCDQQFGTCHADPSNALYWIPPMAGVLIGYRERDDDGGGSSSGYRYTGSLPLYRERGGDYLNPRGDYVASRSGKVTGAAGNPSPPARALTISRSGFGSTAGARSSFGG